MRRLASALLLATAVTAVIAVVSVAQQYEPPEGEQLPRDKAHTFMPEGYNPEGKPPSGFDPTKAPPGFDEEYGGFRKPATPKRGTQQPNAAGGFQQTAGGKQQQQQQIPHGGGRQMPPGFKPNTGRPGDIDENIHWSTGDGMSSGGNQQGGPGGGKGRGGKAPPEPPKGSGSPKDSVVMEQKLTIGEEITTTPRLEAVKRQHPYLVVLYSAPGWRWCESCDALQNATRMTRLVVDRWASYGENRGAGSKKPRSQPGGKSKKKGGGGKKKKGGNEEDDNGASFFEEEWNSAPYGAAARFAWVDCSHSAVLGPFHPCADVKQLPALGLFVNASETPTEWYDSFTDTFSVFNWLRANVPNASKLEIPDETKLEERGMTERKRIQRYDSLLARLSPKEAMSKAKEEPLLALLYEADCRTCREDTVLLETVAHYHNEKRKRRTGGKTSSVAPTASGKAPAGSGDDGDEADDEMPLIVRIPVDAHVRSRWLGEHDVPQIAFFDVTSTQTPQLYFGPRNVTDLLAYARLVSRLDVRIPQRAFNSVAQLKSPALFAAGGVNRNRINSYEELRAFLDSADGGKQRLLYVHSTWQRDAVAVAEMGNAVAAFDRELRRRPGAVKVDLRVLVLCKLSPPERRKIYSMKIFSGRIAPFLLQISASAAAAGGAAAAEVKQLNMHISEAALVQLAESSRWLALPATLAAVTNATAGHYYVEANTLAPVVKPEKGSAALSYGAAAPLLLPFDFYADRDDFLVLVTAYNGNSAESVAANDRALVSFDRAARDIKMLLDEEQRLGSNRGEGIKKKENVINHNFTFVVADAARFPELVSQCSAPAAAQQEIAAGLPIMLRIGKRKRHDIDAAGAVAFDAPQLLEFGSALKPYRHVPWEAEQASTLVLDALLKATGLPTRPDTDVTELTSSNFERVVHDPTIGVLMMFYSGAADPHSQSMMPTFRKVGAAFKNDYKIVRICQLDVEKLDAATRKRYGLTHVPLIRWFERGTYDKGIGETFPGTPFPEAMIEFVSEEMDLPYFDLEQVKAGGNLAFPAVTYKDFNAKIVNEMDKHVVLYLSRGRFRNEAKLDVLRRMAAHFENHTDFMYNFTFARMDAVRYNKKLRKAGLEVDADELPMLIYLPPDVSKFRKYKRFPMMEKPFAEIALARWVTDASAFPHLADLSFNYTEKEADAERDPPLLGIRDLDQTNFMEFVAGKGDRVVMFYAPWCRASRDFMPIFSKVAQHFEGDEGIEFGRIDVPNNEEIGHQQGIQAFPTIITYFEGSSGKSRYVGENYPGSPNGNTLIEYLTIIRQSSRVQALEAYRLRRKQLVVTLNSTEFLRRVEKGNVHALVEFGVSWCGHCHFLEQVLEDIAEVYAMNRKRLLVAYIDCSEDPGREACQLYNITDNFPKLVLFRRDQTPKKIGDGKQLQQLEIDTTVPIRAHYFYRESRFFDEIQSFIGASIPSLALTQSQRHKYQDRRNKEENDFFESLAQSKKTGKPVNLDGAGIREGMPQTAREDTPEARKQKEEKRRKTLEEETEAARLAGELRPGTSQGRPQFTAFPAHVALFDYDAFVKAISTNKPVLVLNYEEPEDNDEMVAYTMMAQSMQPLVERNMLKMGAIAGAAGDAAVSRLLGRHPSVTLFRGLATPSSVRFDTGKFAQKGDGGEVGNVSHLLSFVEKHLKGAAKHSLEITSKNFEQGTQDPQFTTVVFFYAPWDEQCRKTAELYDSVAQILGHHDHFILTRVDISRHSKEYMKLGKRPLPAIYVYDKSAKQKAKERAWADDKKVGKPVAPRLLTKSDPTRDEITSFIIAEDPEVRREREGTDGSDGSAADVAAQLRQQRGSGNRYVENMEDESDEFKALFAEVEREERAAEQAADDSAKGVAVNKKDAKKKKQEKEENEQADTIYMPAFNDRELDGTRYAPLTIPDSDHFHITMRTWPQGALVFFTAEYCSHCPKFEDMYQQAVGPMRNSVVVALMDVTKSKGPMRRCGVHSLPALVYVRPGKNPGSEDDDLSVVHFKGQKSVEEMVRFGLANVQGLRKVDPTTLPPYPEMPAFQQPPSEAEAKDIELLQRARASAEELVTNVTTLEQISELMYEASTINSRSSYVELQRQDKEGKAQDTAASVAARESEAASYKGLMFVFVSSWCGASCDKVRDMALVLANSMEGALRVVIVNATDKAEFRRMQAAYEIRAVPVVAVRCSGEDGSLRRLAGSQLGSLTAPGWLRRASENIAVLFEGFCMKRYSKEELRKLSSMVPEAVVKELKPAEVAALRHENGVMAFIRNARSCRTTPDCKAVQLAFEKAAVHAKTMKDNRVRWAFIDATGDKHLKSALRNRGMEVPVIVYLGERMYGSEESNKDTMLSVLVSDMFDYQSQLVPTPELLNSFVSQNIALERKV